MKTATRFIFGFITLFAVTATAHAAPKGAVDLSSDKLFKSNNFYCGYVSNKWISGRMLSTTLFYSNAAERKNVLAQSKTTSGKKKVALQKKAITLQEQIKDRAATCKGGPENGGPTPTPTPIPTLTPSALRFSLNSAVGLALGNASTSSFDSVSTQAAGGRSNMKKVKSDGATEEVVSSGTASISKFLIAPNNKLYVLFSSKTNLEDTATTGTCLLAEVDKNTGVPSCIEDEIQSITWLSSSASNKSIQFDTTGAIYYLGQKTGGATALRKNSGGIKTDLINDNIYINDFIVLSDGNVIITGQTTSTSAQWVRRITPQGGLQNLITSATANFLKLFPDDNVYMGLWNGSNFGVKRYLTSTGEIESKYWISDTIANPPPERYFSASDLCQGSDLQTNYAFCSFYGSSIKAMHRTSDGKMFAVAGSGANGLLVQYYATLAKPSTAVTKVSVIQGVLTNIILAGLNSSDRNVMTLFNTSDQTEVELIGAANEIEVYRLNYVAADNKIMFDGLRFSDNKYVLGQFDLSTMTLSASQTGSTKLEDFQTF